jgi:acyl carrier protein
MDSALADAGTTRRLGDDDAGRLKDLLYQAVSIMAPAKVDRVRPEHRLVGDLAYDSLRMLELGCVLDDLFGLQTMLLDDAPMTATVGELQSYVERMVEEGRATCPDAQQAEAVLNDLPGAERR